MMRRKLRCLSFLNKNDFITRTFLQPYPNERYDSFDQYWIEHASEFPRLADIETTPFCDARCLCCSSYKMTKEKGIMSLKEFEQIADLLKKHNCPIRGMYTTGNPLMDPTIFEKFAYARKIGAMTPYSDLNTTTSLLTKDLHHKILDNTDNITLSFFAVGSEFERLTGGLNWNICYQNAINFIKERDRYRPDYRIFIGCNAVKDNNLKAVKEAFKKYKVEYARDAELRWSGPVVTGVIDRAIMYPTFRCDGHEGVLQIKWNGNIEACSYDFHEETLYANIWKDDWETIRQKFFEHWRKPFHLCSRCDYYHMYWRTKKNHFRKIHDCEWEKPFLKEGQPYQK
jgi:MoaA/NifB/PqqE/SkfB family radical SAM enzyme